MTTPPTSHSQRAHAHFRIDPMYSTVTARRIIRRRLETLEGHVYDISEAGTRVEFDEPLTVGEDVTLTMTLPQDVRGIAVAGRVVWAHDGADDPGPHRAAVQFTQFGEAGDRDHLHRYLGGTVAPRTA